jgi:acyl carrier protein
LPIPALSGRGWEDTVVKEKIREFVHATFPTARLQALEDETNLLETCMVDSLSVLEVVSFLEREFNMAFEDDELVPENFQTLSRLTSFVEGKLGIQ